VIKNIKKHYVCVCQHDSNGSGLDGRAGPSLYNNNNKKTKKIKKIPRVTSKKFHDFLACFSTNFVQYQAYIVIYELGTKYLIISEIVFLKNSYFKNTKKIFCFRAYDQILKFVQAYFYKKQKLHFFHVLKCKMDIVISLLLSVRV
jgi:hypothetical protein